MLQICEQDDVLLKTSLRVPSEPKPLGIKLKKLLRYHQDHALPFNTDQYGSYAQANVIMSMEIQLPVVLNIHDPANVLVKACTKMKMAN